MVSPGDAGPGRRTWSRWPPEAFNIIKQNRAPAALCDELASLTGNDKRACWRFLNKNGIRRPGSAARHRFNRQTCDALIEYISDHGVQAAAKRFGYDAKSLYKPSLPAGAHQAQQRCNEPASGLRASSDKVWPGNPLDRTRAAQGCKKGIKDRLSKIRD